MKQVLPIVILFGLFSVPAGVAQEARAVDITSEPDGATVMLNGSVAGVTPTTLSAMTGNGVSEIILSMPGYQPRRFELSSDPFPTTLNARLVPRRSRIPVTTLADISPAADGRITLREALEYASGQRRPVGTDRVLIDGPVGRDRPDDIVFDLGETAPLPVLVIDAPLPGLTGAGDRLSGPSGRIAIAGNPAKPVRGPGLVVGPDTEVANLLFDGFGIGLAARGFGTMIARNISAFGGVVGFTASEGAELLLGGTDELNLVAGAIAYDGGLVDGLIARNARSDFDNITIRSGPAGARAQTIVRGWLPTDGDIVLYVRQPETRPLRAVPGLSASTTSFDLYQIFGAGQSDQRWPRHVFDGRDGDYFMWAFENGPYGENMRVTGQRPMRTERFTLFQTAGESRLLKYRFSLLDRRGNILKSYFVVPDDLVDVIEVDPEIDFFGFIIDELDAIGNNPGFTEIEADILDSDVYRPISVSRYRIVFPRPPSGRRAALALGGLLLPLGERAFAQNATVEFKQENDFLHPLERVTITLPKTAVSADLSAALAGLPPGRAAEILIPGTLEIDASLPVISRPDLRLSGGGRIVSTDGTALRVTDSANFQMRDLTLSGAGLDIRASSPASIANSVFERFETAIKARQSDVIISDSVIRGGKTGYFDSDSSLVLIDSVIEAVSLGVSTVLEKPTMLIGNTITASDVPLVVRIGDGRTNVVNLVSNNARPASYVLPEGVEFPHIIVSSLVGDNAPPLLGIPADSYWVPLDGPAFWPGFGVYDIRNPDRTTRIRVLKFSRPDVNCLLTADPGVPGAPPTALLRGVAPVVLYNTGAELVCFDADGGASIGLAGAGDDADAAKNPGSARLLVSLGDASAPKIPGLYTGIDARVSLEKIGAGSAFPAARSWRSAPARSALVDSLVAAGEFSLAFERALTAYSASPYDPDLSEDLLLAVNKWASNLFDRGMREQALALVRDFSDMRNPPADIPDVLAGLAYERIEKEAWHDTRILYRMVREFDPIYPSVSKNIQYSYQEQIGQALLADPPGDIAQWVDAQRRENPVDDLAIRQTAAMLFSNSAVGAIDAGRYSRALQLSSTAFGWDPSELVQNNIRVALQKYGLEMLARDEIGAVVARINGLTGRFGTDIDIGDTIDFVFVTAARTARGAGDIERALDVSRRYYSAFERPKAATLLTNMLGERADRIAAQQGAIAGLDSLIGDMGEFPELVDLREQITTMGNNAGVTAYNAGDYRGAVAVLEKTLQAGGADQGISQNLSVIYLNWSITRLNAGDFDTALSVAEAGRERFPDIPKFTEIIDYISRNR